MEGCFEQNVHSPVLPQPRARAAPQLHAAWPTCNMHRCSQRWVASCPVPQCCKRPVGPTKGAAREEVRPQELGDAGTGL